MAEVIYLTGAPAAGKSTLGAGLAVNGVARFEFGERLTQHLNLTTPAANVAQDDLRAQSSKIITPEHVIAVEEELFRFVEERRGRENVVIDSHPVTKESYGFRVTPFSLARVSQLAPTQIWVLYVSAEETIKRIKANPMGRPIPTAEEAALHTQLQASVAATYGMQLGRPVYLFDASVEAEVLLDAALVRLGLRLPSR